jgi:predicted phage baseplate assembly protein
MRWGDLVVAGFARRDEVRERHGNGVEGVEVREGGRRLLVYFLEHAPRRVHPHNIRIDAPPGARRVRATEVRRAGEDDRELEDHLVVELDHPGSPGTYRLRLVEPAPGGLPGTRTMRGIDPWFDQAQFVFDVDAPLPPIQGAPQGSPAGDYDISYLLRDYEGLRQLMLDRLAVTLPAWTERHPPDLWITLVELLAYVGDDLSYYQDAVATEAYLGTARRRVSMRRHARLVNYRLHDGCNARVWVSLRVTEPVTLPLSRVRFAAAGTMLYARAPLLDETTVASAALLALPQYSPLPARLASRGAEAEITLRPAHNEISLWSWGELNSHLATGATSAALVDGTAAGTGERPAKRVLELSVGDVVILEEIGDPQAQGEAPADPTHRQAVRLTGVRRTYDRLYRQPLLEVRWSAEDALTFDLAVKAGGHDVSHAIGNVVLAGHGARVSERIELATPALTHAGLTFSTPFPDPEMVGRHQARALRGLYESWRHEISEWRTAAEHGELLSKDQFELLERQVGAEILAELELTERGGGERERAREEHSEREAHALGELLARAGRLLARRRRRLDVLAGIAEATGPLQDDLIEELEYDWGRELTAGLAAGRPGSWGAASAAATQDPRGALPVLELADVSSGDVWLPALDLIGAGPDDRAFVAEVDDQGVAQLRIGGAGPTTAFEADYWVGNGMAGNAEAEAINALVWLEDPAGAAGSGSPSPSSPPLAIVEVRNPLPAAGGVDPEDPAAAKAAIPGSFLDGQPRALTAADYASLATALPGVRRAAAELRFSGSLTIIDVAIQPAAGEDPRPELLHGVRRDLERVRRINHVLRVTPPQYRALVVELEVTLAPSAIRTEVAAQLASMLGSGWMPDGTPALFNPQRLAFAQTIYPSPIIAAVHDVDGIQAARLTGLRFAGQRAASGRATAPGALSLRALELARLDNDPDHPEHGYALVTIGGGR